MRYIVAASQHPRLRWLRANRKGAGRSRRQVVMCRGLRLPTVRPRCIMDVYGEKRRRETREGKTQRGGEGDVGCRWCWWV